MSDETNDEQPEEWTPQEGPTGSGDQPEDEDDKPSSPPAGRAIGGGPARSSG